ncbi:neutral/alkaline non-lysosomal ceramidase N-terminal domain-containing protein [Paenibacillus mesophilus]|uniref:neutral/alkaline non-lysosomal ceramidase N-terminal domain-containing protein n=1 Tax=Paenibacillus mesophilus TaxID=2582849 RepID=UPI00130524A7|nr:neutral/alkaline non-lysosomal ceramidase N-terminal domain-containing protein [Paenibacillus mesophilus]
MDGSHRQTGTFAGTGVRDITPPSGSDLAGSIVRVVSTGIAARLMARSIVLESAGRKLVFCAVDVAVIPNETARSVRTRVQERLGIPAEAVMIGATHTHNGPVVTPLNDESVPAGSGYIPFMEDQLVASIVEADETRVPARIGVAVGEEPSLVFNRRLKRPDGRIVMNFIGKASLSDCRSDGPVDPDVFLIRAEDLSGKTVGLVVNFPLHNNAGGGRQLHSDISGFLEEVMQSGLGAECPVLFLAGASGDVNWLDYRNAKQTSGLEEARRIADVLGERLVRMSEAITMRDDLPLACVHTEVSIAERPLQPIDHTDDGCFGGSGTAFDGFYAGIRDRLQGHTEWDTHTYDISAFRIGDTVWISNPGELFVRLGLDVKSKSPFGAKGTCMCTLTNGYAGYIPTPEAFREGGYEVRRTLYSSFLDTEAGPLFVDKSLELCGLLFDREDRG